MTKPCLDLRVLMKPAWSKPAGVWKQVRVSDWLPAGAKFLKPWRCAPRVDQRVVRGVAREAFAACLPQR